MCNVRMRRICICICSPYRICVVLPIPKTTNNQSARKSHTSDVTCEISEYFLKIFPSYSKWLNAPTWYDRWYDRWSTLRWFRWSPVIQQYWVALGYRSLKIQFKFMLAASLCWCHMSSFSSADITLHMIASCSCTLSYFWSWFQIISFVCRRCLEVQVK